MVPPLRDLLRANTKSIRCDQCEVALENASCLLCSAAVPAAPCLDEPFELEADARHAGAGAALFAGVRQS